MSYDNFLKKLSHKGISLEDYLRERLGNDKSVLRHWEKNNFVPEYAF